MLIKVLNMAGSWVVYVIRIASPGFRWSFGREPFLLCKAKIRLLTLLDYPVSAFTLLFHLKPTALAD